MSSKIDGTKITLTRGDTLELTIEIIDGDRPYVIEDGDAVRFALKRKQFSGGKYYELADDEPLIVKSVPTDTLVLTIEPSDTKELHFGEYLYDIELTKADGSVDTFIENADFVISVEVE